MNMALALNVALLLTGSTAADHSAEDRFAAAQLIFDEAKGALAQPEPDGIAARRRFFDAAKMFADLAEEGIQSVNLYINTGNAFHFAGDNARALLWYLRAGCLANTAEIRNGLAALRNACQTQPWPEEYGSIGRALLFWHYDLDRPFKHWALLATYPLGCLMVVMGLLAASRSVWIRIGIALLVIGATMGISDLAATAAGEGQWAVVLRDSKGHAGDSESYSVILDHITPGQEVRIIESREEWVHVELPSGTTCWLPASVREEVWGNSLAETLDRKSLSGMIP